MAILSMLTKCGNLTLFPFSGIQAGIVVSADELVVVAVFVRNVFGDETALVAGQQYDIRFYRAGGHHEKARTEAAVVTNAAAKYDHARFFQAMFAMSAQGCGYDVEVCKGAAGTNK